MKCYRSCYMTDVQWSDKIVTLTDSNRNRYFVDINEKSAYESFQNWINMVFLKGISQTLTVIEYEDRGNDADFALYIREFINV